jgi:hypothetical protein
MSGVGSRMTRYVHRHEAQMRLRQERGWTGAFTRQNAPGAIPASTRIEKAWCDPGDPNPVGTKGTVLGSISHPELGIAYFVEWDTYPCCAVLAVAKKIKALTI